MERVVITGMGTVNVLAKDTAAFARALQESACGIGRNRSTRRKQIK